MSNADNTMHTCCLEQNHNITLSSEEEELPSEAGNITITYDVTQAYQNNYMALVMLRSNTVMITTIKHYDLLACNLSTMSTRRGERERESPPCSPSLPYIVLLSRL